MYNLSSSIIMAKTQLPRKGGEKVSEIRNSEGKEIPYVSEAHFSFLFFFFLSFIFESEMECARIYLPSLKSLKQT